jgi:hypothetical protein
MPYSKADKLSTHLYTTSSYEYFLFDRIAKSTQDNVRLACVKHLDSVQSEPSSNSSPFHFQLSMLLQTFSAHLFSCKNRKNKCAEKVGVKSRFSTIKKGYMLFYTSYFLILPVSKKAIKNI